TAATQVEAKPGATSVPRAVRVNAYWFHTHWTMLPELEGAEDTLKGEAREEVALACVGKRLVAMWVEGKEVVTGGVEYKNKYARWAEPVRSALPAGVSGDDSRLMPVVLGDTLYVLWVVEKVGGLELRGGWMITNGGAGDLRMESR